MFRIIVLPVLALVAASLSSCAATDGPADPSPGATPQALLDRAPLASCGEFTLDQGEPYPVDALACISDAIGGDGAELILTAPSTEGDPITTWIRARPTGGVETWSDVRRDRFAGEGVSWTHDVCPRAKSWLDPAGDCTSETYE